MPPAYHVSRTIRIEAPPSAVYPHVVDLRRWREWSPWEGTDPRVQRGYSSRQGQPGATYTWDGSVDAGEGWMRVTDVDPDRRLELDLHFDLPFPADSGVRLEIDPEDEGRASLVTWTMTGEPPLLLRLLRRLVPMDKMVGRDCEKGLAALKSLVEGQHQSPERPGSASRPGDPSHQPA